MTLANFRTLTRGYVPGYKTTGNTFLDLILNEAVVDIASYTACLKANAKFTVTVDTSEYDLSTVVTDFLTMDKPGLWWNAGDGTTPNWLQLDPKTLKLLDKDAPTWRDDDADDPIAYSIDGDILTLQPTPDTTLSNGLWIYYGKMPGTMSNSTYHAFSGSTTRYTHLEVFNDAIISYAKWKLQQSLNKDGQDNYNLLENAYKKIREEKFSLFKRRLDISAHRDTKLQGRKIRA